ncbi:PEGA domain-containing protein [Candidatus Pacearchaeota archaeon]|nr:PEGA domain-containing protein [Candidatus Pacearchaeota archaeon]
MEEGKKSIVVFIVLMAIAVGIYVWSYPLNKGSLKITSNLSNYLVFFERSSRECFESPCEITLKPGSHQIKVQQDGYFPETIQTTIKRGRGKELSFELKKIPNLMVSETVPKKKNENKALPQEINEQGTLTYSWNENADQLAFIDQTDSKLKTWKNNEIKIITSLKGVSNKLKLNWVPDNQNIFGQEEKVVYFIDTEKASRKKRILDFTPKNLMWIPETNNLLVNDENSNVYQISIMEEDEKEMSFKLNLKNSAWENKSRLIFYDHNKEENQTTVAAMNIESLEKTEILTKFNFPIDQVVSEGGKIFFHHEIQETWYELNY